MCVLVVCVCVCVCMSVCVREGETNPYKKLQLFTKRLKFLVVSYLGVQVQFFVVLVLTIRKTAPIFYENSLVLATFSKVSVSSVQKNQIGKFGRISLQQFAY